MHCSTKPPRINGKVKNRYNQVPPPYNAGIHFLSAPNVSNSGQLQINRKYVNNMGNINEVSVLQYHRTTNMQIKNNNLDVNHFQNLRHQQQQQGFVYKSPQFHNHLNPNYQQKLLVNHPVQRKMVKEQTIPENVLQPPYKHVEFSSKKTKELQNQQEANKINNGNIKILPMKFRKVPTKPTNSQEVSKLLTEETDNVNLVKQNQVPENIHVAEEHNMEGCKEHNKTQVQQDIEQVLNINNEHSEADHCEEAEVIDNSTKNAREKTPMCLINDLARFNKISFQYRLTSENGPAHCKRFTVTLKLGDEEYTAEGFKIKKAQHLAAKEAIEKTKYKHPTPKTNRRTDENVSKSNITPTVELNALAMKLGQQTYYIFDPRQMDNSNFNINCQMLEANKAITQQQNSTGVIENLIHSGKQVQSLNHKRQFLPKFQNRYATPFQQSVQNSSASAVGTYFASTSPCKITLIVGTKQFVGVGRTLQQAKHDAASNALQVLKEQMRNEQLENHNESIEDNDNKSPISLVFEIGIKRNLPVDFKVLREQGPAHMRTFVTACIVGDIVTEGEGTGKKISKKKAAQKMLEELNKLPPLTSVSSPIKRVKLKITKKGCGGQSNNINLVEATENIERPRHKKATADSEAANPITKLIEWHQNKKEKEPVFKLISEAGKENSRRRQFVMEVNSNNITVRGVGSSKKLAKQDAAQNFLMAIAEKEKQSETAAENCNTTTAPTTDTNKITESVNETTQSTLRDETCNNLIQNKETCQEQEIVEKAAAIASSSTCVAATVSKETTNASSKSKNLYMKDQLIYLAKLLCFDVEFSDYPKGNHNEFLSIVMLSTNPPQICHGFGANAKESQEDAAKNALKILSEMGLNNAVKS